MNTQQDKAEAKHIVTANWQHSKQSNPALARLLRLLLCPRGDEIAKTDGDENGIDSG